MNIIETVKTKDNVKILILDKSGKVVDQRIGHNVWTNNGKQYTNLRMTPTNPGATPPVFTALDDRVIKYVGLGKGSQTEEPGVDKLQDAIQYDGINYIKPLTETPVLLGITSPPVGVYAVQHGCKFETAEANDTISEAGLFLSDATVGNSDNVPVAYFSFDPIPKTSNFTLLIIWEVRV